MTNMEFDSIEFEGSEEDDLNEFGPLDIPDPDTVTGNWSDDIVLDMREQPTHELVLNPQLIADMLERHGMPTDTILVDALVTITHLRSAYGSKDSALNSHLADLESFIYTFASEIVQDPVEYFAGLVRSIEDPAKRLEMIERFETMLEDLR